MNAPLDPAAPPELAWDGADTLWLQVAGTLCDLTCRHCFITCGPNNDRHPFMAVAQVEAALAWADAQGVNDVYFTGGEPFIHPDIDTLVELALARGPLTVLTNGLHFTPERVSHLGRLFAASRWSLDLRVSLDGPTAESNDRLRGRGVFERVVEGLRRLVAAGVTPVLTVTLVDGSATEREAFASLLASAGVTRPRIKYLAPFRIGREARRGRAYGADERLANVDVDEAGLEALQCRRSRMLTARGVWPCPILVNDDTARMGDSLDDVVGAPLRLASPACTTCYLEGVSCRT